MSGWTGLLALTAYLALHVATAAAAAAAVPASVETFPLSDVRLLDGPFRRAMETDRAYLLRLDPDRLLSHMREAAGLQPKALHYGGWETGSAGMVGHYLSAISQMAVATNDAELRRRVHYIATELAACQAASEKAGDGYGLYNMTWEREVWFAKLKQGQLDRPRVLPFYVLHKTLAGLRDAWLLCGDETARDDLIKAADWCIDFTAKLTPEQWGQLLKSEYGGPQEVFADVYAITGDEKYLALSEKFGNDVMFEPLERGDASVLIGKHANTQIPKFVGYERIYEVSGDPKWHAAAKNFWGAVTADYSWANGGDGQWESFFDPDKFPEKVDDVCGPETCNTYNMLKLTRMLYTRAGDDAGRAEYVGFYENGLYNHILTSEAPGGGFVYYTSMRPGHYRIFSRPEDAFWCCVGTGMENHGKYGEMIYAHGRAGGQDRLLVNLFIPSELTWKETGVTVRQETTLPAESGTHLTLKLDAEKEFVVSIRRPAWATGMTVKVNGKTVKGGEGPYCDFRRTWKDGDAIDVDLPMRVTTEPLPHGPGYLAFFYGPVLLAGELGDAGLTRDDFYGGGRNPGNGLKTVPQLAKKEVPEDQVPAVVVADPAAAAAGLKRVAGGSLAFTADGVIAPGAVKLVPFYEVFFQRYAVYWRVAPPAN